MNAKILDIGCGKHKLPGSIGLDLFPLPGVDVVHDLNRVPYPFPDSTFNYIRMIHVVEHVQSVLQTMEEVHRIATAGAEVEIVTPHYTDASSWQDPSHIWHLNSRSFDFFREQHHTSYYSKARFEVLSCHIQLLRLYRLLGFEYLINLENRSGHFRLLRKFWEQYLCFLIRGKVMTFRLRVLKSSDQGRRE